MIHRLLVFLFATAAACAAPIAWGPAKNIAADSDVSTNGVLLKAVSRAGTNYPTVNGVTFTPAYAGDSISGVNATNAAVGNLPVGGGISAAYSTLLSRNVYGTNSGSTLTLTLKGLTVGHHYEVQIWANDSDSSPLGTQTVKSSGALDPWVLLRMNTTGASGGKGQFGLGTFTADSTNQIVTIQGSASPVLQAYQVRRITNPLAAIAWERWQETAGDADVNTNGTPLRAYVFGTQSLSGAINGVTFTRFADQSTDTASGFDGGSSDGFGSANAPYANRSGNYQKLLGGALWSTGRNASLTLNNLLPGQWYQVQVWVNDSRASAGGRWTRINGSTFLSYNPGGPSDNLAYEGGLGHHMSGTFRASATAQRFDFGASASAQINGLQLRAIPAPDALVHEAKRRNQHALVGYIDGRITSSSRFDGVHLAFGSGDFSRGRSEMSSSAAWLANNGYTFDIWPAIDATIRWKKYVDAASRNIVKVKLKVVNYRTPGTSNLLKLAQTIRYLGSEEFGEEAFDHPDDDWRSSDPNGRKWLIDKLREESMTGLSEFASNDYGNLNSIPSLTLGHLAQDPEMRAAGLTSFTAFMAQLAAVWQPLEYYAGVWSSRSYEDQSGYYGVFGRELYQALGAGGRTGDGKAMAVMAASGFTLPAPILHAGNDRTTSYSVRHRGDGYQQAFVNANNYILFGSTDGRASGSGWCWGYGVRWRGMANFFWLMGCATDDSEDIWSSSNHGKMQLDFDILLHRDSMLYAFDKSHPNARDPRYAQAQVPGNYQAMINDAATSGRIFLHYGTVMIAVASDVLFNWDPNSGIWSPRNTPQPGDSEFRIAVGGVGYPQNDTNFAANISATNNRFAVAIETALPSEFAGANAAAQLAAFKTALLANTSVSHTDVTVGSYKITRGRYVNRHGDIIEKESYNDDRTLRGGWINGVAVDYANWPKQQNPWMSTTPAGDVLTVTSGYQRAVLNYNQRPTLMTIASSTVPPAAATPEVTTLTPAGITETSATLLGELTSTGTSDTSVTAYWGATDGGTNAGSWANSIPLGVQPLGQIIAPISGLTTNTTYFYRHFASNSAGVVWASNTVSFTSLATPPPPPPALLTHTLAIGSVPIAWQPSAGATSYTVRRSLASGGSYTVLQSGVATTNFTDLLVTNGTVYFYVVSATGPGGESGNSGEVAGTPAVIPDPPTGLVASLGYTNVQLNWNPVPWTTGYRVKRAQVSGGPYALIGTTSGPGFGDNTATNGGTYYYVVSATNFVGESANSGQAGLTVTFTNFLNWNPGNWSAVTWFPNPPGQPLSATSSVLEFINAAPIASTNNLGTFTLNQLRLQGGAVNLAGNPLALGGVAPGIANLVDAPQTIANPITLNADSTFTVAANTLTVSGVIGGANDLLKRGSGTLALAGANTYSGSTILGGGTLAFTGNNPNVKSLLFGATAGEAIYSTLDIAANVTATNLTAQTSNAKSNLVSIAAGKWLTVNGGLSLGSVAGSRLVIIGAGGFTNNTPTGAFWVSNAATLDFAAFTGTNVITVSNFNVGNPSQYVGANPATFIPGTDGATVLRASIINLDSTGSPRGESATFQYAAQGSGILTIRDTAGGTNGSLRLHVNSSTSGSGNPTAYALFDVTGHSADIRVATLDIMHRSAGQSGTPAFDALFAFDAGTLNVANQVLLGTIDGSGNNSRGTATGTLNIGGGTVNFPGGMRLAQAASTGTSASGTVNGTFNLTDGVVASGAIILGNLATGATSNSTANATLNLEGGTLTLSGDLARGTGTGVGTLTSRLILAGGTLDLKGNDIGSASHPLTSLTFSSGTLRNVASINGTAGLTKSSSDTLWIEGTNTYAGATTVSAGTLVLDGSVTGAVTVAATGALGGVGAAGGLLTVHGVVAPGLAAPDADNVGTLTVGAVTLAGSGRLTVTMTNATAGPGAGWDLLNAAAGAITVGASNATPFVIALDSLGAAPAGWNPYAPAQWKIVSGASVAGFAADKFTVDTSDFAESLAWGTFAVAQIGNDLYLTYTTLPPPAPPSVLIATPNNRLVTLTWNAVTNATAYTLRRATAAGGPYAVIASGVAGPVFHDADVSNGTTYFYTVASVNPLGEGAASAPASATPPGPMGAWRHRMHMTFAAYDRAETLTNFPVLIVLGTNVPNFSYSQAASPKGGDLRFTDGFGSELSYEIERWNTNGLSHVWVRLPALNSLASLWAYWGNAAATNPPAYTTNGATWSEDFLGVWHLTETGGAHYDSSPALETSRFVSASQQGTAAGIAGGADNFNGTSNYVSLPDMGTVPSVTVEAWVNLNGTPSGGDIGLVSSDPWSAGVTHFKTSSTRNLKAQINGNGTVVSADGVLPVGAWAHVAYTVGGSGAADFSLYLNGALLASAAGTANNILTDVNLAREYNGRYLNARMDEVRISSVARSSNWLWATWQNLASNSTFLSFSAVVPNSSSPPVPVTLVAARSLWRYRSDGVDLGANWRSNGYNDAAWPSGPARLGFGGDGEVTLLNRTNANGTTNITFYFRRAFHVPNPADVFSLAARMTRDDGAVIYLNGAEVWRDTMPTGAVSHTTFASAAIGTTNETNWLTQTLDPTNLVAGWNTLAAEIHQQALTSSDIGFDFELTAVVASPAPAALSIAAGATGLTLAWPADSFFAPYAATNLTQPVVWTRATNEPVLTNGLWTLPFPLPTNGARFYRLQTP